MRMNLHRFSSILVLALAATIAANAGYAAQKPKSSKKHIQLSQGIIDIDSSFKCAKEDLQCKQLQSIVLKDFNRPDSEAPLQCNYGKVEMAYDMCSSIESQIDNDLQLKQAVVESLDNTNKTYDEMAKVSLPSDTMVGSCNQPMLPNVQQLDSLDASNNAVDCMTSISNDSVPLAASARSEDVLQSMCRPLASHQTCTSVQSNSSTVIKAIEMPASETNILIAVDNSQLQRIMQASKQDLQNASSPEILSQKIIDFEIPNSPALFVASREAAAVAKIEETYGQRAPSASLVFGLDEKCESDRVSKLVNQEREVSNRLAASARQVHTSSQVEDVTEERTIFVENDDWFSSLSQMYLRLKLLRETGKSTTKILRAIDSQLVRQHDKSEMLLTNTYSVVWSIKGKLVNKSGKSTPVVGFKNALAEARQLLATTISEESGVDFSTSTFRSRVILDELEYKMENDYDVVCNYYVSGKGLNCLIEINSY